MGRPPIGERAMTGAERLRRHRAKLRAARAQAGHKPSATACAWCGRSDRILVGENAVMLCGACIEAAAVAVREARAARRRAAAAVDALNDDVTDLLPGSKC